MYYWLIYSTSTGSIGTHSSTHPPTVSVTVKDAEGNEATTQEFDTSLLPSGFSLIGLYDDTNPMDSATQAAYDTPAAWLYQGGKFVANPAYDANAFSQAQHSQLNVLATGLNSTLNGGFTAKTLVGSATTPHMYPSDSGAQANFTGAITAFTANPNKTTVTIQTLDAGWVSHTKAEFYGVYSDGDAWKEAQYPQLGVLEAKVNALKLSDYTTLTDALAAVQAVVWTAATY